MYSPGGAALSAVIQLESFCCSGHFDIMILSARRKTRFCVFLFRPKSKPQFGYSEPRSFGLRYLLLVSLFRRRHPKSKSRALAPRETGLLHSSTPHTFAGTEGAESMSPSISPVLFLSANFIINSGLAFCGKFATAFIIIIIIIRHF